MDGIDGIAGSEAAAIGIGLVLFAGVRHRPRSRPCRARPPRWRGGARISGVELGAGEDLSRRCRQRAARLSARVSAARCRRARPLAPALILPLYFLADATLTLLRRLAPRRARLAGASRAFLPARGAARARPRRGRAARDRRRYRADRLRLGGGEGLGIRRARGRGDDGRWRCSSSWPRMALQLGLRLAGRRRASYTAAILALRMAAMSAAPRPIRRALISVSDKAGLVPFARGARRARRRAGLDRRHGQGARRGRARGDRGRRRRPAFRRCSTAGSRRCTRRSMAASWRGATGPTIWRRSPSTASAEIDLLVCNLYPFAATVALGRGPRRLRREHRYRRGRADPRRGEEPRIRHRRHRSGRLRAGARRDCDARDGAIGDAMRRRLAAKAFALTAAYDAAIAALVGARGGDRLSRDAGRRRRGSPK